MSIQTNLELHPKNRRDLSSTPGSNLDIEVRNKMQEGRSKLFCESTIQSLGFSRSIIVLYIRKSIKKNFTVLSLKTSML